MSGFYDQKIDVHAEGVPLRPVSFTWRGSLHQIAEIQNQWHDWHVGKGGPKRLAWKQRRHRNYFRVVTTEGRTFDIYYDRKCPRYEWILYRELD
jgi:hypothetical protein